MAKINHSDNASKTIVLLDSFNDLENHSEIIGNSEFEIITFNYNLHKLLKSKNIRHKISDQFLINDTNYIQEISRKFSYWYKESDILDSIKYDGINLGKLFYPEFHYFLVPFLKSYFEISKIYQEYKKNNFLTSSNLFEITKLFSNSVNNLSSNKNFPTNYLYDSLKIPINIGNIHYSFRLPNSYFKKLKNLSEKLLKFFLRKKFNIPSDPSILLIEFDTLRYKKLFENTKNSKLNFVNYGRRRPVIWNHESFSIIKNSNCLLIDVNKIFDDKLKNIISRGEVEIKEKLEKLWETQEFFEKYFSIDNLSLWNILKPTFINLMTKRSIDAITEIEITKKVFQLYNFKNILILSEHGYNEQILIQIAKQKHIPITLLQHGVYFDTKEALSQNIFAGIMPIESDLFFAWGNAVKEYLINSKIPSKKILSLGSIAYDEFFEKKQQKLNLKSEYILLALAWPVKNKVHSLTVEILESYEKCIREICTIVSNENKKLIVKIHPYAEQEDLTNFIKKINPEITVIKNGNVLDLIRSCQIFVTLDLSSTILEAQILAKPVISIMVPNFTRDLGNPEIFKNNSCIRIPIDQFKTELDNLSDPDYRKIIVDNGNNFVKKYFSHFSSSSAIISYLEKF